MLQLWGRKDAFNVQKVLWFLDELNLEYDHIPAGGSHGKLDTAEFLAMNPHGRVPVISDNGHIVWDSHAILRYLAEKYSAVSYWPKEPKLRSNIDSWMNWQHTSLQPAFMDKIFWAFYRTPEDKRNSDIINEGIKLCSDYFKILDKQLAERKYICGDEITLADIVIGTTLYRFFSLTIEQPEVPNVKRWYGLLQQRPAYQRNVMLPFDYMYGIK